MGEPEVFDRELEEWGSPEIRTLSHIQERMLDPEPEGEQGGLDVDRFHEEAPPTGRGEEGQEGESSGVEDHPHHRARDGQQRHHQEQVGSLDLAVDIGASETVISEDMLPKQGDARRRGVQYEVANDVRIPNLGEKKFQGYSEEGAVRSITTQVCEVNKGLLSVEKVVEAGNRVVLDSTGSYIEDKKTHERLYVRDEAGMYMLRMYVRNAACEGF